MAFTPIDPTDIEVGKPTKKRIFETSRTNFNDHESRINSLEAGASKVEIFVSEIANLNQYVTDDTLERVMLFRASRNLRIINAQIYVLSSSSGALPTGGILEFDIRVGTDISALTTVFATKPSVTGLTEGSTNSSVNFVTDGELVNQGEWIALDITNLQIGQSRIFIDVFAESA